MVFISYIDQIPKFFIEPTKYEFYTGRELFVSGKNFVKLTTAIVKSVVGSLSGFSKGQFFYVDPIGLFCNGSSCTCKVNGDLYYQDDDHFNLMGSKYISLTVLEVYFSGQGSEDR